MQPLSRLRRRLPERHRRLITLLIAEPTLVYTEISEPFAMPGGSIGPIRGRRLDRRRRDPRPRALRDQATAAYFDSRVLRLRRKSKS